MNVRVFFSVAAICLMAVSQSNAQSVPVTGGMTSVQLNTNLLGQLGLSIGGVSDDVIVPGSLPNSVGFPINPRNAASPALPTTFIYTAGTLSPFSGALQHTGSIFFASGDDLTETGNFEIGYDALRATGNKSGFFVRSTVGLEGILFDIATPTVLQPLANSLTVQAPLLFSPELAAVLDAPTVSGLEIGQARIEAVPEPASTGLVLAGSLGLISLVRRRSRAR
ncbi:MAG: PEP-CTERM sorting domain-containing protein [Pirellulales bacterium]